MDGGAKYLTASHKIPDILSGDFDSVSKDVLEMFRKKGTQIIETPDQNDTDFTKAVQIVLDSNQKSNKLNSNVSINDSQHRIESIITIWSSMGRIDQVLSNINTLYMNGQQLEDRDGQYVPIFLLQINGSVTWLLNKVFIKKFRSFFSNFHLFVQKFKYEFNVWFTDFSIGFTHFCSSLISSFNLCYSHRLIGKGS